MTHYSLNDGFGLQPDDFCRELFQPISELFQPPDHGLSSSDAMLGDIPLPCRMEEVSAVTNKWDADLHLRGAEGSSSLLNKSCTEKCVQTTMLNCKVCGKVFSSTGSLNKHSVTHSQERSHICKICMKAFKRQDHLMGHMLTHLKVKPFVCMEPGCHKSYCDFRSLRRHYELHHGLWTKQPEVPTAIPALLPSRVLDPVPGPPVLPNVELIRRLATEILQQKVTSNIAVLQDTKANHGPQTMTLNSSKWSEDFAARNTYTVINSSSKVSMDPAYARYSDPLADHLLYPAKIRPLLEQPDILLTGSFNDDTLSGEFKEPLARHPNRLDHRYASPAADNGHQAMQAQYSFPHAPDFTRLTIQLCPNSDFQIQNTANVYPPVKNSPSTISHTATLTLPSMSMPQWHPETTGIRGWGELQRDPQGLITCRISGAAEDVASGSQNGATQARPGQESQTLANSTNEIQTKLGRSQCKSAINLNPSTVPASQVALESFTALNISQGNDKMYRLSIGKSKDIREGDVVSWQRTGEATEPCLGPGSWTRKDETAGRLVIPVSVPVTKKDDKVNGLRGHHLKSTMKKGKETRPCPLPLYIPPPVSENNSAPSGCFQSSMRSPDTPLSEYFHKGALHCQYTPPPMLSPIRQGTGLYFHTFCAPSSAQYQPPSVDDIDTDGVGLVIDATEFSVQPHINIGDRFQAAIPECRDRTVMGGEEEKADLVWRPRRLTAEISHLVKLACSSAVPGGGCNLELALHCLHFSGGNVLETLEKLLDKKHQKLLPRCLVDYHYAGSDHWSETEKRQFKNAYCKARKDFSYIQAMIPGKSIHQCVEYYYIWKKAGSFERRPSPTPERALCTEQGCDTEEPRGGKEPHGGAEVRSKKKTGAKEQKETREENPIKFPCQLCDRVFDKVKSRNAHMKKHRLQEEREKTQHYESQYHSISC
ncbi:zinc finger protein 541 isoform X2 [Ranitomeya variabilis]